jgi:hypothetical protein
VISSEKAGSSEYGISEAFGTFVLMNEPGKPASQGKLDSEEYVHPMVPAPLPGDNFGMCPEHKAMSAQPVESGIDQNCSECDPVPKPRGNPKRRMQWLPETAGSEQIGTVCHCRVDL